MPNNNMDSSNFVAARGSDGFIYVGGREGLYRLEGVRERGWFPNPGAEGSLPAGHVRGLAATADGLWVGTGGGLAWFDLATERFEEIDFLPDGAPQSAIYDLLLDGPRLYIGHAAGGTILDATTRTPIGHFETGGEGSRRRVYDLELFRGEVAAVSPAGLLRVDVDGATGPVLAAGAPVNLAGLAAAIGPDGALWATNGRSAVVRVPAEPEDPVQEASPETHSGMPEGTLSALGFDSANRLWIATDIALSRWDPTEPGPRPCRTKSVYEAAAPASTALLTGDVGPFLLVGSRGRPLALISETPGVRRFVSGEIHNTGIPKTAFWSATVDHAGRVLLGTLDGLYRETAADSDAFEAVAPATLGELRAYAVREDEDRQLWVGTNRGVFVVEGDVATRVPLVVGANGNLTTDFTYALKIAGDRVLAATSGGLAVIDRRARQLAFLYLSDPGTSAYGGVPSIDTGTPRFWHVEAIGDEAYAVGDDGVYRLDLAARTIAASTVAQRGAGELRAGKYYASTVSKEGRVFIATEAGIIKTDPDFQRFEYMTELDGARMGSQLAAARGPDGNLWFAGQLGLLRHDPAAGTWQRFTPIDGMHSMRTTQNALTVTASGRVLTGSATGVTLLNPRQIAQHRAPTPRLVSVRSGDREAGPSTGRITLGPQARDLTLAFAVAELPLPPGARLEYRFGPAGDPGPSRELQLDEQLSFPSLAPADYVLEALVTAPGREASEAIRHELTVQPHWWETDTARAAGFISAGLLLLLALSWRSRIQLQRVRLLGDERRRIAQDLHDTFLQEVFGALVVGRSLESDQEEPEKRERTGKLVNLLEQASRSARASVDQLGAMDDAGPLVETLISHTPGRFLGRGTDRIEVREVGEPWRLRKERAFCLQRAAREAMTNACKHARAERIDVTVAWARLSLQITIVDDGVGFDVADAASDERGFGLGSMERLADAGRATLTIDSQPGRGTTVTISARRFLL
ncbi:MAG: ATP-binding protein [Pseudomonadota bacterium]